MRMILISICCFLIGCRGPAADDPDVVDVAAAFFPVAEAAEIVGAERVRVDNLTPPGTEPHDVELVTGEVDAILDAELVLYVGGGFQPAVEDLAARSDGPSVDLLRGLDTIAAGGGEVDPHVWLDPTRYADLVEDVAEALSDVDPDGAEAYEANAAAHAEEIRSLDDRFERRLAACEHDLLVVSHAAFGYLADRYGLRQEPIAGISPESEPDPERVAELTDLVEEEGATTVFTETLVSPEVAETLAREAGVRTAVLNPLEGLTPDEEAAGETYLSVMERNLETVAEGLGCPT